MEEGIVFTDEMYEYLKSLDLTDESFKILFFSFCDSFFIQKEPEFKSEYMKKIYDKLISFNTEDLDQYVN